MKLSIKKNNFSIAAMSFVLIYVSACSQETQPRDNPVGREHRSFVDEQRISWKDEGKRPLATTIWYPAAADAIETDWNIAGIFKAGRNALNADIIEAPDQLPLIVLSHGTGGAALQLSWLAETLASHGYIVAAINHHGNTAAEDNYLPQGFVLWWERALDLSVAIDKLLLDPQFGARINPSKIGASGFSIGGYTALALAGAQVDLDQWKVFCDANPIQCMLPPEADFTLDEVANIIENDAKAKQSMSRSDNSYKDPRVKAVYSIAPVLGQALNTDSLSTISIPVHISVGSNDNQAAAELNAEIMASNITDAKLTVLPDVAHYTFLSRCSLKGKLLVRDLCSDPKGVQRAQVHAEVGADILRFFEASL